MPEAGLKATNIDSRLGYLKKRFNALLEIKHKGSGFGWDDGLKMVTGDRKLFDEWCKSHRDAKGLYRKPFPLFDAMEEIYSKDRATGVNSNMPLDRVDQETNNEISNAETQSAVEVPNEESEISKRALDETSNRPTKKKARKNKEIQNMQKSFEKLMGTMLENSNSQIAQLTAMLEGPKNFKTGLREELGKVNGISRNNILTLLMTMTESDVAIFRDLTDEDEKYDFLGMILARD
ncbi:uncharacterized protein LOC141633588 [Silene latifolia]|uniref:uncharacterized protein LOC141633588 n=1 Tax=Silene latifolia TaxID=37657 RepID=UPI003D77B345